MESTRTLSNFDFQWTKILYVLCEEVSCYGLSARTKIEKDIIVDTGRSLTDCRLNECKILSKVVSGFFSLISGPLERG